MTVTDEMAEAAAMTWYGNAWRMLGPADRKKVTDDMRAAVTAALAKDVQMNATPDDIERGVEAALRRGREIGNMIVGGTKE